MTARISWTQVTRTLPLDAWTVSGRSWQSPNQPRKTTLISGEVSAARSVSPCHGQLLVIRLLVMDLYHGTPPGLPERTPPWIQLQAISSLSKVVVHITATSLVIWKNRHAICNLQFAIGNGPRFENRLTPELHHRAWMPCIECKMSSMIFCKIIEPGNRGSCLIFI
jgi:hypothetical protein